MKDKICEGIYNGTFNEGGMLPSERKLSELLGVSRVTLRKSLDFLAEHGLIEKDERIGSTILLPNHGSPSDMSMIVLIAPSKNAFFSEFIREFQDYGQKTGSMILYAEKPRHESLTECIYRFWQKDIRNIAIWPEDVMIEPEKLKRLRALGMNMVFFDSDSGLPYADCVALNNKKAVHELCSGFNKRIGYVGWEDGPEYSRTQREQAFTEEKSGQVLVRLSWKNKKEARTNLTEYLARNQSSLPDTIFYCDQECGVMLASSLNELNLSDKITLIGIDSFPGSENSCSRVCVQNLKKTVEQIFVCLRNQNQKPYEWTANMYLIDYNIIQ